MGATNLGCRECGAAYELDASYVCSRCFGPLEVVYDHSALTGDIPELRRRIQAGPQNIWRYADFLPVLDGPPGPSSRASSRAGLPAGCTPRIRADRRAELRLVTEDGDLNVTELGGVELKRGQQIMAVMASANHDPERFPNPEFFDISRDPNRHLAFGTGIHACLGATLARLEAEVAFTELLNRFPDLGLGIPRSELTWRDGTIMRALTGPPGRA